MKVLIVCSGNSGFISPFILDQAKSLKKAGISINYFTIKGNGLIGYSKNFNLLVKKIKAFKPDLIHAHYGFSGLLAALQRKIPVVTTFHGGDIYIEQNSLFHLFLSWVGSCLSGHNIFVNETIPFLFKAKKYDVIPCGVDLKQFYFIDKISAREILSLDNTKKYGLFASNFTNKIKNYPLANKALSLVDKDITLLELYNYSRKKLNLLMNAVDFLLVTSLSETGPLVVKEAMACNCPIVSVNVGDVKKVVGRIEGCFITTYDPGNVAENIRNAITYGKKTNSRERIIKLNLDSRSVAKRIINLYTEII